MKKGVKYRITLLLILVVQVSMYAAESKYSFCVQHPLHGTFKAEVYFEAMDLGQLAARKMLEQKLQPIWSDSVRIAPFTSASCACGSACRILEVRAKDWDSAPATIDSILSGTKEAFENPGAFVKGAIGKAGKMLGSLFD